MIPAGLEVIVPEPVPALAVLNVYFGLKVTLIFLIPAMVTVQVVPAVESQPVQPIKTLVVAGVAAKITTVPD